MVSDIRRRGNDCLHLKILRASVPLSCGTRYNEIFARNGATFQRPDVRQQFQKFAWYQPKPGLTLAVIEQSMSDIERQNVKALSSIPGINVPNPTAEKSTGAARRNGSWNSVV